MKSSMSAINKDSKISCFLLFDAEKKGSENQCVGLATAMGLSSQKVPIKIPKPWVWLPRFCWPSSCGLEALPGTPPSLIICSGRKSAAVALRLKEKNPGLQVICLLNPRFKNDAFDLIITPKHDKLQGANVVETIGVLHHLSPKALEEAKNTFSLLENSSTPNLVVLMGGSNKYLTMTDEDAHRWAQALRRLCAEGSYHLWLTFSRRTPILVRTIITQTLKDLPGSYIWDGVGENPYFAFLKGAHTILVTGDSVSMLSEAASLGKPLYILLPQVRKSSKFDLFWEDLVAHNHARFFQGSLDPTWIQKPLDNISTIRPFIDRVLGTSKGDL